MMKKHGIGKRLFTLAATMMAALALTSVSPMSHVQAASQVTHLQKLQESGVLLKIHRCTACHQQIVYHLEYCQRIQG